MNLSPAAQALVTLARQAEQDEETARVIEDVKWERYQEWWADTEPWER